MYSVSRLLFLLVLLLVPAAAKAADTDIYVEKGATQEETNKSIVTQLIAISYPAQIAGFSKTSMVKYKSDLSDYSAEYRFNAGDAIIHNSFYVYDRSPNENQAEHYNKVKSDVFAVKPNTVLISEDKLEIVKKDKKFVFSKAMFKIVAEFEGKEQELYSELYLTVDEGKYIFLRSTTTYANKDLAQKKNLEFLNEIKWTLADLNIVLK